MVKAGPWQLMLISAAVMLGPGFLRLWLSRPGIADSLLSQPQEPSALPSSESPGSSSTSPVGEQA